MAQAVADASSLIHLEKIEQLGLLEGLFGEVAIPQAVAREVHRTLPQPPAWIHVHTLSRPIPSSIAKLSLGPGESETMLDALLATGFRLSPKVYRTLLSAAGEEE